MWENSLMLFLFTHCILITSKIRCEVFIEKVISKTIFVIYIYHPKFPTKIKNGRFMTINRFGGDTQFVAHLVLTESCCKCSQDIKLTCDEPLNDMTATIRLLSI